MMILRKTRNGEAAYNMNAVNSITCVDAMVYVRLSCSEVAMIWIYHDEEEAQRVFHEILEANERGDMYYRTPPEVQRY